MEKPTTPEREAPRGAGADPFQPFLARQGLVVLDGGLATALEDLGHDLSDALWSARLLLDAPESIARVHTAFLEAGADCITTASYQATVAGFAGRGLDEPTSLALLDRSVTLATEARDRFRDRLPAGRLGPLVAASVGPYGAHLADGSEYRGDYGLNRDALIEFHAGRLERLVASDADLIACETIPSLLEAEALAELIDGSGAWGWISFSCRDGSHLADGTPVAEAVEAVHGASGLAGVGVNCTHPRHLPELIRLIAGGTDRPVLAYPNSGETWDGRDRCWRGNRTTHWIDGPPAWREAGARVIGGCCRVRPEQIRRLRATLLES